MIIDMNRTEQLQAFFAERKGLVNSSGFAKAIGISVPYFHGICRGYKLEKGVRREIPVSDDIWERLTPLMKLCGWQGQGQEN